MKFYLISDDSDALTGMHLAGIEGELVSGKDEAAAALMKASANESIGILLITDSITALCAETVQEIKLKCNTPLLVEIPGSDDAARPADSIMKIVHDAIGI